MRLGVLAVLLAATLAGCVSTDDVATPLPGDLQATIPEIPFIESLGATEDCFTWHNIPFTDVGWPDKFLPAGYTSADASSVWGMPVNFQFSAAGMGIQGCFGDPDTAEDDWWFGVTHIMVEPPSVEGVEPVRQTSTPSPMTATDGGFNMYILEFYAEGRVYEELVARGWNVRETTLELHLPTRIDSPANGVAPDFYYYDATQRAEMTLRDADGIFATQSISPHVVWNHRNFEFMFFTEHSTGTGVANFTQGDTHLLVGPAQCDFRENSIPDQLIGEMPYLGPARQRTNGDCPDDALGALWISTPYQHASLIHLPEVFAQ